ncbi:MAG: NADH-quinone oxidoreductase subunit C [Terriglobia bacterium]
MSEQEKPPESKPAAPKPAPPKPKGPGPEPLENELVRRLRARFPEAIGEATQDREQAIVFVSRDRLLDVCDYLKYEEKFNFLTDVTAVDRYRGAKRFEVVYNLYSFSHNVRLRLKVHLADDESVPTVSGLWGTANWLEREAYDMFGIHFDGHPYLKRILLPEEWKGHPLRKDYDIIRQDTDWVRENLGIESGQ